MDPTVKTELQTNGLFKEKEDTYWIARNITVVWFSLDGPPEINDKNRPDKDGVGRTSEIESNMRVVAESTIVGVRATITENTIDLQDELVQYYYDMGVREMAFNPVIKPIERGNSERCPVTKVEVIDFARGFIKAYHLARRVGIRLLSSLTFNFDERTEIACSSCVPMPQLNPDGSVSSCDMALYWDTKKELQEFIYGMWSKPKNRILYLPERIEKLNRRRLGNLPKCDSCEVKVFCAGGCAGRVAFQTGSMYDIIPEYCVATKYLARHMSLGEGVCEYTHP